MLDLEAVEVHGAPETLTKSYFLLQKSLKLTHTLGERLAKVKFATKSASKMKPRTSFLLILRPETVTVKIPARTAICQDIELRIKAKLS